MVTNLIIPLKKFLYQDEIINVKEPIIEDDSDSNPAMMIIPLVIGIGVAIYIIRKRKKSNKN